MRISDWSSDVCSSDLLNLPKGSLRKAFPSWEQGWAGALMLISRRRSVTRPIIIIESDLSKTKSVDRKKARLNLSCSRIQTTKLRMRNSQKWRLKMWAQAKQTSMQIGRAHV